MSLVARSSELAAELAAFKGISNSRANSCLRKRRIERLGIGRAPLRRKLACRAILARLLGILTRAFWRTPTEAGQVDF